MEIAFHWHNLETSDPLKQYAEKKILKLTEQFNSVISITVRFRVEKIDQICEIAIHGDGAQIIATESASDMYAAVDLVEKKLNKQIRKHKEKHEGKHQR
ncbi:MAG: ribosome-associated translation inhibitor RaiA [Spirochaetales bacterium]|nr:ribosome-associated translation inhibitor RaiA [Spirochaetales bacterium]